MKNFLSSVPTLVMLFFFFPSVHAQVAPSIEWQKCLGGSIDETSNFVQQAADGGFIVAGYSKSIDGDVSGNHGNTDYWFAKLDASGALVWQKSLGGSDYDVEWSFQNTSDGGFIVAGQSKSNDGDVSGNHGNTDYWIVKLDPDGNLVWQKSLGGSDFEEAWSVQETSDGGFIVAGHSKSNDGDVTGNHGEYDYWVVKLDVAGNLIWQRSLGGSSDDEAYAVVQAADGGFIIAGESESNDGDVSGNHGEADFWVVKLDASGNLIWQRSFGGSDYEEALSIQQTTDGGFIVAGPSASNDGEVSGNHGYTDYWIVKLDADGNLDWQKSLGGSAYDFANYVQQTFDDGFIVAGHSYSNDGDVSGNHGLTDYWIVKLEANGNLVWQKTFGGSNYDQPYCIQQSTDSGFVIAGLSFSNDGDVSGNHGSEDCWVVKLTSDQETGIASISSSFISLYPNPVQNQLTINLAAPANEADIRVLDVQGRIIVLPITFANTEAQLNTTALPDGFYTIQIINSKTNESMLGKFEKQ